MYEKEEIIRLGREVHGDKYDYSVTEAVKNKLGKIRYRCKKHNYIHEQTLHNHLQGKGCPLCAEENRRENRKLTKDEFLKKASLKRNDLDKYDFDKVDFSYRDELGRMKLYCKEHGEFYIRGNHFINGVEGCKFCNGRERNDEEMREELLKIHPTLDFSESKYSEKDRDGNIKVTCPIHGTKLMRYWNLMHGEGCYECSMKQFGLESRLSNEEIIRKGEEAYGKDTYAYGNLDTLNRKEGNKILVTCPKHGDFAVNVSNFITGKSGCPICKSSKMEMRVRKFLENKKIKFEQQKTFEWLRYKSNLYLDFYLPDYNIAIECQGKQHFIPVTYFGGESNFEETCKRDETKKMLCKEHNIKVLYLMDKDFISNENDFSKINNLYEYIKNNNS